MGFSWKIAKILNPLEQFLQKVGVGRVSGPPSCQNFTIVALEMWAEVGQNHKNMEFLRGRPARRQKSVSERPKMVHLSPSLTLHLVTLKVSPLKGEKTILEHSSTTMQTFMPFGVTIAEISRDIEKKYRHTWPVRSGSKTITYLESSITISLYTNEHFDICATKSLFVGL